jgi:uncharacterized protein (TIGR03435 family)
MTQIIDADMLLLSSSLAASILGKATVIATLGLLGAWLTRRSRAAVRHAVLAASFAVLLTLPIASTLIKPVRIALPTSTQEWAPPSLFPMPMDAAQAAASADGSVVVAPATPQWRGLSPSAVLLAVWIAGAAFFLLRMIFGLQQVRELRRFGLPWRDGQSVVDRLALAAGIHRRIEVSLHESLPAPVTCGIVRPAIVLPPDVQDWEAEDLNRAIVHELEHVRRFDWASHCLARVACAVYWFHPLVWAAWRQLALEAERSCDDAVLMRSEATAYADQLVGLARRLSIAQPPALAMANRSDLSARVGSVLDGSRARGRAGALLVAVACAVAAVVVLTMSPLRMVAAPQAVAPAAVPNIPKWDAVSIKRCTNAPVTPVEGRGAGNGNSPDRLTVNCWNMYTLINTAYIISGRSSPPPYRVEIEHLPSWADSERYTIEAKAEGAPGQGIMRGPMLQALLEDRFALKIHPETKEGGAYILTVAKSGLKMPSFQGGCTPIDLAHPQPASPIQNRCLAAQQSKGFNRTFDIAGFDLDSFAQYMANFGGLDGPVLNETGVSGFFHVHLEYSLDRKPGDPGYAATDDPPFPSIFTALEQQLGLTLKAGKAPHQFLVVDHVEKPREN